MLPQMEFFCDSVFKFELISHHSLEKRMLCGIIILSYFIQKEKENVRD